MFNQEVSGQDQKCRERPLIAAEALMLAAAFFGSGRALAQEVEPVQQPAAVILSETPQADSSANPVPSPTATAADQSNSQTDPGKLTGAQRFDIAVEEAKRLFEDWKTKVIAAAGLSLVIAGAIGAVRSAAKMIFATTNFVNQLKDFRSARCIASPSFNLHTFEEQPDGSVDIVINTLAAPALADLFKNGVTRAIFSRAVDLCSEKQPLPTLAVGDANFLPRLALMYVPFFPKSWVPRGAADPISSIPLRREINSLITDAYSSKYDDGIKAYEAKLPVVIDDHYVIPVCDLKDRERELVFVVLSKRNFERFSTEEGTRELIEANPENRIRLTQLRKAYLAHEKVLAASAGEKDPELMFPLIRTYVRDFRLAPPELERRTA